MIPDYMFLFANHVWQSTLFAILVWLMILTLRKNRAAVRHRLWLAASIKFLVPFSLFAGIGSYFQWETTSVTPPLPVSMIVETISQPFSVSGPSVVPPSTITAPEASRLPAVLIGVWICGVASESFLVVHPLAASPPGRAPGEAFESQWTPSGNLRSGAFRTRSVWNLQARPAAA